MKLALNNSRNANELYKAAGEELAVEIVCYSQGLHMLRDDTSPVKAEIHELRKVVPQVAFGACNNTKTAMEKRERTRRARRHRAVGGAAGSGLLLREAVTPLGIFRQGRRTL